MKSLLRGMSTFTLDIRQWDVSGVTDFVSNSIIVLQYLEWLLVYLSNPATYFIKIVTFFVNSSN